MAKSMNTRIEAARRRLSACECGEGYDIRLSTSPDVDREPAPCRRCGQRRRVVVVVNPFEKSEARS